MQRVCRTPTPLTPLLFAFQAVLVLAGFGGVWLSVRGQHPYTEHISGWAIAVVVAVAIINVGATAWVNGRAGASGSDPAQRRWQAWKVIMVAAWITAYATTAPHYHAGVSHPVWGLYPVSGLLATAVVAFALSLAFPDRPAAEAKGNDDHGRPDEQGDDVGDHQRHDPGRRPVSDPQQEPDEQDREIAHRYLAGRVLAQHATDLQQWCEAHQHRP